MSDDDDEEQDRMPEGVLRRRKGWGGEEMELSHVREKMRDSGSTDDVVAVDLNQFRNTVVGEGYQAKHVVRQKSGVAQQQSKVVDMSSTTSKSTRGGGKKRKHSKKEERLAKYLRCAGVREFRRQLEELLK